MERKIAAAFEIRGVRETVNELAELELELNSVNKALKQAKKEGNEDAFKAAKQSQESLKDSIKDTRKEIRDQVNDFKKQQFPADSLIELRKRYSELRKEIEGLSKEEREGDFGQVLLREADKIKSEISGINQSIKSFGKQKFPEDSIVGLRKRYSELRKEIQGLSKDQRESDFGKNLIREAKEIKEEIIELDQSIGDFSSNIGNYQSAFTGFGGLLSSISSGDIFSAIDDFDALTNSLEKQGGLIGKLGGELSALGGPATLGITAAAIAVFELGNFIRDTTLEFEKLRQQATQTTGAVGEELDRITVRAKTFSEVFNKDFNETVEAANVLAKQFGISYDEAFDLIEQGTLAGADANGEFFDQIREYPAFFKQIGADGAKFIQLIDRQIKEGIFSDKGIDAIKEASIRLTELPQSTQDALNKIGFTSDDIRQIIDERGLGGAIEEVSKKLNNFERDSEEVGAVLADVFGGAGEDAGDFVLTLTDITDEVKEISAATDEYTKRQQKQLEIQKAYNEQLNILSRQFEGIGSRFEGLGTIIQTFLLAKLNDVVLDTRVIFENLKAIATFDFDSLTSKAGLLNRELEEEEQKELEKRLERKKKAAAEEVKLTIETARERRRIAKLSNKDLGELARNENKLAIAELKRRGLTVEEAGKKEKTVFEQLVAQQRAYKQEIENAIASGQDYSKAQDEYLKVTEKVTSITKELNEAIKQTSDIEVGSIADLQNIIARLNKEINQSTDENEIAKKIEEILSKQKELDDIEERIKSLVRTIRGVSVAEIGSIDTAPIESAVKQIADLKAQADIDGEQKAQEGIQELIKQARERRKKENEAERESERKKEIDLRKQIQEAGFEAAQSIIQARGEIRANELENEIAERQEALDEQLQQELAAFEGNEAAQDAIRERFDAKQEELDKEAANQRKELARKEALINAALSITKVFATTPFPASLIAAALVGVQTAAQIATINSQEFAFGGEVKPYENVNGTITQRANIRPTRHGDNVLIKAKAGEKILNKEQQRRTERIAGADIWSKIGLPNHGKTSFNDGGIVPQIVNPNETLNAIQTQRVDVSVRFSEEELDRIADKIGSRTKTGIMDGLNEVNSFNSEQEEVNKIIG